MSAKGGSALTRAIGSLRPISNYRASAQLHGQIALCGCSISSAAHEDVSSTREGAILARTSSPRGPKQRSASHFPLGMLLAHCLNNDLQSRCSKSSIRQPRTSRERVRRSLLRAETWSLPVSFDSPTLSSLQLFSGAPPSSTAPHQ